MNVAVIRIYGGAQPDAVRFEAALIAQWEGLDNPRASLSIESWDANAGASTAPSIHVYFAGDTHSNAELRAARSRGEAVIPVVDTAPAASALPSVLAPINAFICERYATHWPRALAAEVLTRALLPRRAPKIFISYRRCDSRTVALQLRDRFVDLGCLVFLDTMSIPPAEDFQQELMWWLNDADLVVFLQSPRIGSSAWVRKEVEFTRTAGIGMQVVAWPDECFDVGADNKPERPTLGEILDPDTFSMLRRADLQLDTTLSAAEIRAQFDETAPNAEHALTDDALGTLVADALQRRVVAVHERQLDLEGHVLHQQTKAGGTVVEGSRPGDLKVTTAQGLHHLARVFPCRPDPVMLRAAADAGSEGSSRAVYRENYPNDERATSLKWLADRTDFILEPISGKP